jgi:hypothetical protein
MDANGCPTPRKDGGQCRARPTKSGYCLTHDPDLAGQRAASRQRGGKGKSRMARAQKLIPEDLQVLDTLLDQVVAGIYQGGLVPAQGSAIAAVIGAKVRIREISLKIMEQTELTARVERLEAQSVEFRAANPKNGKGTGYYPTRQQRG